ncbi:hypothetical protein C7I55_16110 [Sphingomonas deserti]|uniref:Nicotinamide riboside transporter PnuC n=1 Tax=Allosphingosinicella deserti TaxID=2116704 RepID=A0A2P7QLN1_9SPHN|nr:hypothetical protein C7I55_16110 [Sphingomonas deserti]
MDEAVLVGFATEAIIMTCAVLVAALAGRRWNVLTGLVAGVSVGIILWWISFYGWGLWFIFS